MEPHSMWFFLILSISTSIKDAVPKVLLAQKAIPAMTAPMELPAPRETRVTRDLPVLPVPMDLRDRLARLELMERSALTALLAHQAMTERLVILDRQELMELLELMVPVRTTLRFLKDS